MNLYDSIIYEAIAGSGGGGGGGSSKYVTGEFTAQATEGAQDIEIPYTGDSYITAVIIEPADGYGSDSDLQAKTGQNGVLYYELFKYFYASAPAYSGNVTSDAAIISLIRKSSNSGTAINGYTGTAGYSLYSKAAVSGSSYDTFFMIRSNAKFSIYVRGTGYGFFSGVKYRYHAIYR